MKIALVGDYDPDVTAHRAIPAAIEIASNSIDYGVSIEWLNSIDVPEVELEQFSGFWGIPASPYQHMQNVLDVISYARRNDVPYLGTCGGYQHAALEFAKNQLGYDDAANGEVDPEASMPLISALVCRLSAEAGKVVINENSKLFELYQNKTVHETYNCGFGINTNYLHVFDGSDLVFTGFDDNGDPKALELKSHRFFIGTAFQPERSVFAGECHPVIKAFLLAISNA